MSLVEKKIKDHLHGYILLIYLIRYTYAEIPSGYTYGIGITIILYQMYLPNQGSQVYLIYGYILRYFKNHIYSFCQHHLICQIQKFRDYHRICSSYGIGIFTHMHKPFINSVITFLQLPFVKRLFLLIPFPYLKSMCCQINKQYN